MWVSPDIQKIFTMKLNNVKIPFSSMILFLDDHIAMTMTMTMNDNERILLPCSRYIDTSNHTHSIHHC